MSCGRNQPSTIAPLRPSGFLIDASSKSLADTERNSASDLLPIALANFTPLASASASVGIRPNVVCDSAIAPRNNPLANGDAARKFTLRLPPDSPQTVTFEGSPPNWAILFLTHRIPAN